MGREDRNKRSIRGHRLAEARSSPPLTGSGIRGKEFVAPEKSIQSRGVAAEFWVVPQLPQIRTFSPSLRRIETKMWNSGFESYGSSNYGGAGGYTQSPGGFGSPGPSQAEKKSVG
nr:uncharacterized protein LOC105708588 [Aotus nancymaae]